MCTDDAARIEFTQVNGHLSRFHFIHNSALKYSSTLNENTNEGDNICSVLYLLWWEIASGEYCPVPDNESYIAFSKLEE